MQFLGADSVYAYAISIWIEIKVFEIPVKISEIPVVISEQKKLQTVSLSDLPLLRNK